MFRVALPPHVIGSFLKCHMTFMWGGRQFGKFRSSFKMMRFYLYVRLKNVLLWLIKKKDCNPRLHWDSYSTKMKVKEFAVCDIFFNFPLRRLFPRKIMNDSQGKGRKWKRNILEHFVQTSRRLSQGFCPELHLIMVILKSSSSRQCLISVGV